MEQPLSALDFFFLDSEHTHAILKQHQQALTDIQFDLGRDIVLRYGRGSVIYIDKQVTKAMLDFAAGRLVFDRKNRAVLAGALHRISRVQNTDGELIGLTFRVARPLSGLHKLLCDVLDAGDSILVLGAPGSGKTSLLRTVAHYLSDKGLNTAVVDFSCEIAGSASPPHECIGNARHFPVRYTQSQGEAMIEVIENHTPHVMVVDELSDWEQASAARSVAERGIQLIASAHGSTLEGALRNPQIRWLFGGVGTVVVSDDVAKQMNSSKSRRERKEPGSFTTLVVLDAHGQASIYRNMDECVDAVLDGKIVLPEQRRLAPDGSVLTTQKFSITDSGPFEAGTTIGARVGTKRKITQAKSPK